MKIVIQHPHTINDEQAQLLLEPITKTYTRINERAICLFSSLSQAQCAQLQTHAHTMGMDIACLPADMTWADFDVLAMDMDSTLINIECIDEIADLAGKKTEVARITEAAMRGEITDFNQSLIARMAFFADTPVELLQRVLQERLRINAGAHELMRTAKMHGIRTVLVSGGFTYFAQHVARELGIDYIHANELEIDNGRITGRVVGDIVNGQAKAHWLTHHCNELGVAASRGIALGDGANDLPMMNIAGLSCAYRAKPTVQAQAMMSLNYVGLDGLACVLGM